MQSQIPWLSLTKLGGESAHVIGLRVRKLAKADPAAFTEATMMVSEKIAANMMALGTLMTGGSARQVVSDYRKKVRANRRRLSK